MPLYKVSVEYQIEAENEEELDNILWEQMQVEGDDWKVELISDKVRKD